MKSVNKIFRTSPGQYIQVRGRIEGDVSDDWFFIREQISTNAFIVYDTSNPDRTGIIRLQAGPITGPGQGRIRVYPFGGGTEYLSKFGLHRISTFEGNSYSYNLNEAASQPGQADIDVD